MIKNVGSIDRIFRFVLGVILLAAPFVSGLSLFASGPYTVIAVIIGIVMIATSTLRICPLYSIFGIRTCKA